MPGESLVPELATVDLSPLRLGLDPAPVAAAIEHACTHCGFFYLAGHGVDAALIDELAVQARRFFELSVAEKSAIRMELGGRAWRGYFPLGAELTSGKPDQKEGLYFGSELDASHPKVRSGTPLHGPNQFPVTPSELREVVLRYLDAMTEVGHLVTEGLALSLGLDRDYFRQRYTAEPLVLFRIFHYPSLAPEGTDDRIVADEPRLWSVGEHTDYGFLTLLLQDDTGGLQVKSGGRWIEAPPLPGTFVCNIGDMLDRMTGGHYRSTPHRVLNRTSRSRLSFPFFFDPGFDARVRPIDPAAEIVDDAARRWDGASVHEFEGTYGDYLLRKVGRVFPELGGEHLDTD